MKINEGGKAVINSIIEAYISVFGKEAWDGMTAQKQHDIVMAVANGAYKALTEITK